MAKALILNPAQAEAVYSAMCALNNVSAKVDVTFGNPDNGIHVYESKWGHAGIVYVHHMNHGIVIGDESYLSQSAFATAYGLNADAAPADDVVTEEDITAAVEHLADVHNGEQLRSAVGQLRGAVVREMARRGLVADHYMNYAGK